MCLLFYTNAKYMSTPSHHHHQPPLHTIYLHYNQTQTHHQTPPHKHITILFHIHIIEIFANRGNNPKSNASHLMNNDGPKENPTANLAIPPTMGPPNQSHHSRVVASCHSTRDAFKRYKTQASNGQYHACDMIPW